MKKSYEEKFDEYIRVIHQYEIEERINRIKKEIEISKEIFNEDLDYDYFINNQNDFNSAPVFSNDEMEYIIKRALNETKSIRTL